jgi:sec-independent protein translocase protein TatA
MAMGALAPWHWAVLIVVIVVIFGGSLLPRLGRFFGKSVTGLKQGLKEGTEEFKSAVNENPDAGKLDTTASSSGEAPKNKDG